MQPQSGRRRAGAAAVLLAAALLVGTGAEAAAPSEGLDKAYGVRGLATGGGSVSAARRLDAEVSAKAPGGGLVVAGTQFDELGGQRVTVARFTPQGQVDTTFNGGWVTFDTDPQSYAGGVGVCDVLVQPDGAVLVSTLGPSYDTFKTFVYRFLPNGARDTTFSGDGKLVLSGRCRQLALRSDGRILATTWSNQMFVATVVFQQFLADGRPDTSFDGPNGDGERSVLLTQRIMAPSEILDVALQGERIVVVGSASFEEGGSRQAAGFVARFTPAGLADKTFSGDGWLLRPDVLRIRDAEVAGPKIVILGDDFADTTGTTTALVGRLHGAADAGTGVTAGQWDTAFSGDGVARRNVTWPQAITVDSAGTVTALGHRTGFPTEAVLWRYDANGTLDPDYGGNAAAELSQCDGGLGQAACFVGVGVHSLTAGRVLVGGEALPCPDLSCPKLEYEGAFLPTRLAGVRTVADPLVAVYAETYPYVYESDAAVPVSVRLTSRSVAPVTVQYETLAGSAKPGVDYTARTGTLTFNPGQVTKVVNVPVIDDTVYEGPDTWAERDAIPPEDRARRFTFRLLPGTVTGATVPVSDIKGGILDDEFPPAVSVTRVDGENDIQYVDENAGSATLSVRLSHAASRTMWVELDTLVGGETSGWATPGEDFVALDNHRVTFQPGEVVKPVTVPVVDDAVAEEGEALWVQAIATSYGSEFVGQFVTGTIAIVDDDGA